MVSWKASAPPFLTPGLGGAVGGPGWFRLWETPWAGLCSTEARRAWRESPPQHKHFCQSVRAAAASGSVGRVAGVTHDVTDNDTSRVSHSHTVPHNVTPGTPCKALTLGHKHPGPSSPAATPGVSRGAAQPGRGLVGEPRGQAGERVMSRAAVGGSPGGEAPPGEFRESSAALH